MSSSLQPLVSVVTPAYNEEKYLAECIESVLAQSYTNWEYTIVNNQSTDRTLEIASEYARRDPRIRVITTPEFYPQHRNLNFTMQQMSPGSAYCKMVQADDWLFPECLRLMVDAAESHPTVGIIGSLRLSGVRVIGNGLPYPSLFIPGRELARIELLDVGFYTGSPSGVMFRSEIVRARDPFYPEETLNGDVDAYYEILQEWDFSFVHQVLSFYRLDNVSISSQYRSWEPWMLDRYACMTKFGPAFFTPAELPAAHGTIEKEYYRAVAKRALQRPGKAFWEFHHKGLATVGLTMSKRKLAKALLVEVANLVLNPKNTVMQVIKSFAPPAKPASSPTYLAPTPVRKRADAA